MSKVSDETLRAPEGPHGWIQFKGTDLCMDVHCECGELTHVDGDFVYSVECGACGRLYAINGNVRLVRMTREQAIAEDYAPRRTEVDD